MAVPDTILLPEGQTLPPHQGERLGIASKALYGSGQILDSVSNTVITTFLFFYVTAVCGLPNALAGIALGGALVIDALADPLIGSLSDNTQSRWGRRHPFLIVSVMPLAVAFGLLFSIPRGLGIWPLFAYVTLAALAVRIGWSVYGLPYAALGAELSDDYHERSSIAAWRLFFGIAAQFGCVALGFSVFLGGPLGTLDRAAYTPFGWTCAVLIAAGASVAAFGTLGLRDRLHSGNPGSGHLFVRLVRESVEVMSNRSFLILASGLIVYFIAQGVYLVLLLHALNFFWALPPDAVKWVTLATQAGLVCGLPAMALVRRRLEKRTVLVGAIAVIIAAEFFPPVLKIAGLLPTDTNTLARILIGVAIIGGAVTTAAWIAFQSAFADAADEHELLFGSRREGLYYAALSLSVKAAAGVGALVAGLALDIIGFPSDIAAHPHVQIGAGTLRDLGFVYGPAPAVVSLLAAAILLRYRLDQNEHSRILTELNRRRTSKRGLP